MSKLHDGKYLRFVLVELWAIFFLLILLFPVAAGIQSINGNMCVMAFPAAGRGGGWVRQDPVAFNFQPSC